MNHEHHSLMMRKIYGYYISFSIGLSARLQLAERIGDGALSVAALSEATGTSADALYRMMKLLASDGIFVETAHKVFANTSLSQFLIEDHPGSLHHLSQLHTSELLQRSWKHLAHSVHTARPATELVFGTSFYGYLDTDEELRKTFDKAMVELQDESMSDIHQYFDFSGFRHVYDIGGGYGRLLRSVSAKYPGIRVSLFEKEDIIHELKEKGAGMGMDLVAGDFFDAIPGDGDLYILQHVLHNWSDDAAVKILRNCCAGAAPGTKILVIEMIMNELDNSPHILKYRDMNMLVCMNGGRQRTLGEFTAIFEQAGLQLDRVTPLASGMNIMELLKPIH